MNLNLFGSLASVIKEELEKEITKLFLCFTDNESSAFEKGKKLIDDGAKFGRNDSDYKVLMR